MTAIAPTPLSTTAPGSGEATHGAAGDAAGAGNARPYTTGTAPGIVAVVAANSLPFGTSTASKLIGFADAVAGIGLQFGTSPATAPAVA